jgi:integrase
MVKLRKKKLNDGKLSLYLDIYNNGNRRYEFLKLYLTSDRKFNKEILSLAETIRAKKEIEIKSQEYGFVPSFKKQIDFIDYMYNISKEKNPSNRKLFQCAINYVKLFSKGKLTISNVNETWLKDFEKFMFGKLSNNSIISYFRVIKVTLNIAVREKIIGTNPFKYYQLVTKKEETARQFLTFDEIMILNNIDCNNSEVKRAFLFACYTGLRISDIINLKWSNIKDSNIEIRQIKTNIVQHLPLSETARNILYNKKYNIYDLNNDKVFMLPCFTEILRYLNAWVLRAGINKHITTHCARHTFATLSLTHGVDLFTVSKLLGHTDIKTTQVYAKIIDSKKVEAVNMLPKINFG